MRQFPWIFVLALAGLSLLGRAAAPDGWSLPAGGLVCLGLGLAAGAVVAWSHRARPGARALAACLAMLVGCVGLELAPQRASPIVWQAREDTRIQRRFATARTKVLALESQARSIARQSRAELEGGKGMEAIQTLVDRLARTISLLEGGDKAGEFLRRVTPLIQP